MDPMEGLRTAMAAVDAYYKKRGIFQGKFGFGERPALVVIDMAYGWTDAAYAGGSARLDAAVAAIRFLPHAEGRKSRDTRDDPLLRQSGQKGGGSFAAAFLRKPSSANNFGIWGLIYRLGFYFSSLGQLPI